MFINPQTAIKNGWITGIKNPEKQIQPNAIDFTLDKVFIINDEESFGISEDEKVMKGSTPCPPQSGGWMIQERGMIDCLSDMYCDLPKGVAAMLVIRSSLARNGLLLVSGLYDSGFKGHIGFLLHNCSNSTAHFATGTRVGQIIFVHSTSSHLYAGDYNHESGTDLEYQQEYELKDGTDLGHETKYLVKKNWDNL